MTEIAAFVGHSFDAGDSEVVRKFLDFFDRVRDLGIGFSWDHAEAAEPKLLSQKVKEKLESKNTFIGICTKRECTIEPSGIRPCRLARGMAKLNVSSVKCKTSDWILQEIGFAVSRDMQIVLLLEAGLRDPGELQGDIEYIPFVRDAPEKAFTKILEMIKSLQPKPADIGGSQSVPPQAVEAEGQAGKDIECDKGSSEAPTDAWDSSRYSRELAVAILQKDKDRETVVFNERRARLGEDADACAQWEAEHLYYRCIFGKDETIGRLGELAARHPGNWTIRSYLGSLYMKYKQYGSASVYFAEAAKIADDHTDRLKNLYLTAVASAKDGNFARVEESLSLARREADGVHEDTEVMLRYLVDVTKETNEVDLYLACNEALLNMNPSDHDRRFALAFKYSELNLNDLSLYHYRILADERPTEGIWNNIGVAAERLNMPIRSVHAYRRSEELGGTLALSNLAHRLLDAGFVAEADQMCQKAMTIPDYDKQVGRPISRVKDDPKLEEDKEKGILENTCRRRAFFVALALASIKPPPSAHEGTWRSPEGDFQVVIKDGVFSASGEVKSRSSFKAVSALFELDAGAPESTTTVRYEGRLHGMAVVYSRWEENKNDSKVTGLMYLTDDLTALHIYDNGPGSSGQFSKMVRVH